MQQVMIGGISYTQVTMNILLPAVIPAAWGYKIVWYDGPYSPDKVPLATCDPRTPDDPVSFVMQAQTPSKPTLVTAYAVAGRFLTAGTGGAHGTHSSTRFAANNIVDGITISCQFTIGTTGGTIDTTAALRSTLAASMTVLNNLFGVAPAGITNPLLGSGAVATINVQNLAVTNPLLASLAVAAANMAPSSVTAANGAIASLAVQAANMAASSVTASNGALGASAVQATNMAANSVTAGNGAIANLAVGTAAIQTGAITNALIANLAVGTAQLQDLAVTNAKIHDLTADKITAGTFIAGVVYAGPVNCSQLVASGSVSVSSSSSTAFQVIDTNTGSTFTVGQLLDPVHASGNIRTDGVFKVGTASGITRVVSVSIPGGTANLTFTGGILTGYGVTG